MLKRFLLALFTLLVLAQPANAQWWAMQRSGYGGSTCISGNDAYTKLLIHSNTTDGSVTFVDSGKAATCPHAPFTVAGNTHHEADQKKFGTTSIYFDGTGDYLSLPDHADWDFTGNWTVDFWMRLGAVGWMNVIGNADGYVSGNYDEGWGIFVNQNGATYKLIVFQADNNAGPSYELETNPSLSLDTWYHVAVVYDGSAVKVYVDGTYHAPVSTLGAYSAALTSSNPLTLGREPGQASALFTGYLDEIRISNIVRWTDNFTPPTGPYCD